MNTSFSLVRFLTNIFYRGSSPFILLPSMPVCEASPGAQHKRLRVWGRSRRIRGITSSLWWARSWPIRGPHCVPSTNQRPGRSDPLQWFPSLPPPGPASVQILCKKKIAAKVHSKQQMQKYATITVEVRFVVCFPHWLFRLLFDLSLD